MKTQSSIALAIQNHYQNHTQAMTVTLKTVTILTAEKGITATITAQFDKDGGYQIRVSSALISDPAKESVNSFKTSVTGLLNIFDRYAAYYIKQAKQYYKNICIKEETNNEFFESI